MRSQITNPTLSVSPLKKASVVSSSAKQSPTAGAAHLIEETLVVDERAFRSPAEAVEEKLSQLLEASCIGVSHLRLKSLLSDRKKTA
jgi:hypothetical protein